MARVSQTCRFVGSAAAIKGYRGAYLVSIATDAATAFPAACKPENITAPDDLPDDAPDDEQDPDGKADLYLDAYIRYARTTLGPESFAKILRFALTAILEDIKDDLAAFGAAPDEWFSGYGFFGVSNNPQPATRNSNPDPR